MTIIPFAAFMPDMPDLAEATTVAYGCVPQTEESYGPIGALSPATTNTVAVPCVGMLGCNDLAGNSQIFAGSASNLYHMQFEETAWSDVSGQAYNATNWRFVQFEGTVLATDYADPIQSFNMASSTKFGPVFTGTPWAASTAYASVGSSIIAGGNRYTLTTAGTSASSGSGPTGTGSGIADGTCVWNYQSGTPPKAQFIAVAKSFAIVASTNDPVGGVAPYRVWWSAANDPTTWPSPGSNAAIQVMSDYNDLSGPMGSITGLAPSLAGCDCAVFFERGVFTMSFVGPPDVFDFFPAQGVRGCIAPDSIVVLGEQAYFLGEDGFYAFNGYQATPIGAQKVDRWFFDLVAPSAISTIVGAADVAHKAIVWSFQSKFSTNGQPDSLLFYRWDIGRWSWASISCQWLVRAAAPVTVMGASPNIYGLQAGTLQLAAVDLVGRLAFFNGPYLQAQIGTKVGQLTPGRRSWVRSCRPLVDSSTQEQDLTTESDILIVSEGDTQIITEGAAAPTITVALSGRTNYQQVEVFGPDIGINAMGECPQRSDARYHRARVTVSANSYWTQALGVDVDFIAGGLR